MRHAAVVFLALTLAVGCNARSSDTPDAGGGGDDAGTDAYVALPDAWMPDAGPPIVLGTADRPARVVLPTAHDGTTPLPLIILLHGYGASAALEDLYLHLSTITRASGAYLVLPDGTPNSMGHRFWNAMPACCNFEGSSVDDVAYLTSLIDQAEAMLPIDRTRIYFFGHSNGGFMSYRMACEISPRLAAIAVLAGGDYPLETDCVPTRPVSVLHIHGTADTEVLFNGMAGGYTGAVDSSQRWARRAHCDTTMAHTSTPIDFDSSVDGAETTATSNVVGCMGGVVTLYRMEGSGHLPTLPAASVQMVVDWLLARSAPAP
jgi:polyhydroxybutyrate depolymerase